MNKSTRHFGVPLPAVSFKREVRSLWLNLFIKFIPFSLHLLPSSSSSSYLSLTGSFLSLDVNHFSYSNSHPAKFNLQLKIPQDQRQQVGNESTIRALLSGSNKTRALHINLTILLGHPSFYERWDMLSLSLFICLVLWRARKSRGNHHKKQ
jgi:hypothetical protein